MSNGKHNENPQDLESGADTVNMSELVSEVLPKPSIQPAIDSLRQILNESNKSAADEVKKVHEVYNKCNANALKETIEYLQIMDTGSYIERLLNSGKIHDSIKQLESININEIDAVVDNFEKEAIKENDSESLTVIKDYRAKRKRFVNPFINEDGSINYDNVGIFLGILGIAAQIFFR